MRTVGKEITFGSSTGVTIENPMSAVVERSVGANVNMTAPYGGGKSHYHSVRSQEILDALTVDGYDKLIPPTETELVYVASVYENKGYTDINVMTSKDVNDVGRKELENLNEQLKVFTKSMKGLDTTGVFEMIDSLSQAVDQSQLGKIWEDAVNAKPTLIARLLSVLYPNAIKKSILNRFDTLTDLLQNRGKTLESKFDEIERALRDKKDQLGKNIDMLRRCFELYYNAFIQLRQQFILVRFMEYNYSKQIEVFKAKNKGTDDLVINTKLMDYERILKDLTTRRLLLHKTLLQLPITSEQNKILVGVSKNLIDEIDNTLLASMPVIRMNFVGVKAAIDAERAMISNNTARELEANSNRLNAQMVGSLGVRAELMSGQARLDDAKNMAELVDNILKVRNDLVDAKEISKQKIDEASRIMYDTTDELKRIFNETN